MTLYSFVQLLILQYHDPGNPVIIGFFLTKASMVIFFNSPSSSKLRKLYERWDMAELAFVVEKRTARFPSQKKYNLSETKVVKIVL